MILKKESQKNLMTTSLRVQSSMNLFNHCRQAPVLQHFEQKNNERDDHHHGHQKPLLLHIT